MFSICYRNVMKSLKGSTKYMYLKKEIKQFLF